MGNKQNPLARYIGQVWNAVNYYQTLLSENSIIIGDFNSNQIWDEKERVGNHTDVVNLLKAHNIESLYHNQSGEVHGQESQKTFFMYRNVEKSYHIDYVFASNEIIKNGFNLVIDEAQNWMDKSDHVPIVLDIQSFENKISCGNTYTDFAMRHLSLLNETTIKKFGDNISDILYLADELDEKPEKKNDLILRIETIKEIDLLILKLTHSALSI